jgi:hypothetical protein
VGRHVAHRKKVPVRNILIASVAVALIFGVAATAFPAVSAPVEQPLAAENQLVPVVAPDGVSIAFERPSVSTVAAPVDERMSLSEFIAMYEGTYQVLPGYSTAECMALFSHYNYQLVHGDAYSAPGAQDVWLSNTWSAYDRIDASQPAQRGDVVLWSGSFGAYQGGGYGHVGIVLEDHGGTLLTLSQNPTPIVQLELSKSGVLGYLRPKNLKQ